MNYDKLNICGNCALRGKMDGGRQKDGQTESDMNYALHADDFKCV